MSVETADVVVIGGGVNGASIAYALAARGVKRVVLLEQGAIALRASLSGAAGASSRASLGVAPADEGSINRALTA